MERTWFKLWNCVITATLRRAPRITGRWADLFLYRSFFKGRALILGSNLLSLMCLQTNYFLWILCRDRVLQMRVMAAKVPISADQFNTWDTVFHCSGVMVKSCLFLHSVCVYTFLRFLASHNACTAYLWLYLLYVYVFT